MKVAVDVSSSLGPALLAALLLVGLGSGAAAAGQSVSSPAGQAVLEAGLTQYRTLRSRKGNLAFSPYGLYQAANIAYRGASGQTARELQTAFGFAATPSAARDELAALRDMIRASCRLAELRAALPEDLLDDVGTEIKVANALWVQEGLSLRPEFLASVEAEIFQADFRNGSREAAKEMSDWVMDSSRLSVQGFPRDTDLPLRTGVALLNSTWFEAGWQVCFDSERTKTAAFWVGPAHSVDAPMMFQRSTYRYAETQACSTIQLPYMASDFAMTVLLPHDRDGLGKLEESLSPRLLRSCWDGAEWRDVAVRLPRFRIEGMIDLSESLRELGVQAAFDRRSADFSGMSDYRPLWLGSVRQGISVDVDETGTRAGAVTMFVFESDATPREPLAFTADHPFLYVISHSPSGTPLFIGRVSDPTVRTAGAAHGAQGAQ